MAGARIVQEGKALMGWIILILLAASIFGAILWLGKPPRVTREALAAAIMLGMAGYALQGQPGLRGAPAKASQAKGQEATELIMMRSDMDDQYGPAKKWLTTADAFARTGNFKLSSSFIRSGLKDNPDNADLWSALGLQLLLAGEGRMSVAAKFAFDRVRKLSPKQPAPDYFEGLSALFEGQVDTTIGLWQGLLANAPEHAKWKPRLESQLGGLMQMRAQATDGAEAPAVTN